MDCVGQLNFALSVLYERNGHSHVYVTTIGFVANLSICKNYIVKPMAHAQ